MAEVFSVEVLLAEILSVTVPFAEVLSVEALLEEVPSVEARWGSFLHQIVLPKTMKKTTPIPRTLSN